MIAALTVVYVHWAALAIDHPVFGPQFSPVPAFVCLSGILIPASFADSRLKYGTGAWKSFAWKRFLRVYPALGACFAFLGLMLGAKSVLPTIAFYATMGLWRVAGQANGALWSLMLEELLYVGHVILQIRKWWNARTSAGLMALCILGWMICRQDAVVRPIFEASTAFFVGNLAYFNMPKIERIAGWKFVGIFIAIRVFANLTSPLPATAPQMLFYSTSSAVLLVLAARNLPQIKWRKMPDLSYGCYIFHVIVLTIVLRHSGGIDALWWTLAGSLSLAAVSWYCLESQALKWKERPPHGSARRAIETEDLQWEWLS